MLLDAKYDNYTDQQLMAEASSFDEVTQPNTSYEDKTIALNIPDKDLPSVIGEQVNGLKALKRNVDDAIRDAEDAKNSAETASYWKRNSYLFGLIETKNVEDTIENVQKALQDLAKAQQSAAQAQKVSYQNQEKIGQITRYLFALGASNIAANRSVVNRLKRELEGASASELNEMARQEIIAVIRQLKAQEDLLNKQKNQGEILREHDDHFKQIDDDIKELSEKQSNSLTKEEHNNDLKEYIEKLEGIKNLISDAEKGLLDKIGKRQTIENAKQEKQAFIDAVEVQKQAIQGFDTKLTETAEEQKKALAEEVQKRNDQLKQLTEQHEQAMQEFATKLTENTESQKNALAEEVQNRKEQFRQLSERQEQSVQGFDTKLAETAEAQKKALAEEVQNRNDQLKQLSEEQDQTLQELEQRNNEELGKIDAKYNDAVRSLTNNIEEYKKICYKHEREIEDLKNKLNDLNVLANGKVEKKTAIGIALLAFIALCVAVMPFFH